MYVSVKYVNMYMYMCNSRLIQMERVEPVCVDLYYLLLYIILYMV